MSAVPIPVLTADSSPRTIGACEWLGKGAMGVVSRALGAGGAARELELEAARHAENEREAAQTEEQARAETAARLAVLIESARARIVQWWRHVRADRGQTTTEYLMITAVLTAVVILLAEIIPPMLLIYFQGIAVSISSKGI